MKNYSWLQQVKLQWLKTVLKYRASDQVIFIGEMSTLTGNQVSADVIASDGFEYAYWSKLDLVKLESLNLSLYNRFMMAVCHNLIEKLHTITETVAADSTAVDSAAVTIRA
jgi:hypothetical protein